MPYGFQRQKTVAEESSVESEDYNSEDEKETKTVKDQGLNRDFQKSCKCYYIIIQLYLTNTFILVQNS